MKVQLNTIVATESVQLVGSAAKNTAFIPLAIPETLPKYKDNGI